MIHITPKQRSSLGRFSGPIRTLRVLNERIGLFAPTDFQFDVALQALCDVVLAGPRFGARRKDETRYSRERFELLMAEVIELHKMDALAVGSDDEVLFAPKTHRCQRIKMRLQNV